MKLRTRLMCYTAAVALTAGAAFAAIDGNALADDYLSQGYTFVEVKVGPTQTKVEAIKNGQEIEVIYDNETLAVLKQETQQADADDANRTGKQVRTVGRDFTDHDDDDDDDDEDDHSHGSDHDDDDDDDDDDHGSDHDDDDDDDDDDHGSDHDDDDDHGSDDD